METVYINGVAYYTENGEPHFGEAQSKEAFIAERDQRVTDAIVQSGLIPPTLGEHPDNEVPSSVIDAAIDQFESTNPDAIRKAMADAFSALPVELQKKTATLYSNAVIHMDAGRIALAKTLFEDVYDGLTDAEKAQAGPFIEAFTKLSV